jgi:predicted esterase
VSDAGGATARTLVVPKHARVWEAGPVGHAVTDLWVGLHGYGQLAEYFVRHLLPLVSPTTRVLAPEALNRFYLEAAETRAAGGSQRVGATWMTREDREHEIADYIAWLDLALDAARAQCAPDVRVHVLGFSQGGTTAVRWLSRGRVRATSLLLWAAQFPDDVELPGPFASMAIRVIAGDADVYVTPERRGMLTARLDAAGVPFSRLDYAGTHRIYADVLQQAVATL